MAWAGSHSQPSTWRRGNKEKDNSGKSVNINNQIMKDSGSLKIESLLEFPPLKRMDEDLEIKQEYSFLDEPHEEKDNFYFTLEEKKKSFLVEDIEESYSEHQIIKDPQEGKNLFKEDYGEKKINILIENKEETNYVISNSLNIDYIMYEYECNKDINNLNSFIP